MRFLGGSGVQGTQRWHGRSSYSYGTTKSDPTGTLPSHFLQLDKLLMLYYSKLGKIMPFLLEKANFLEMKPLLLLS